jgi:exopolyphosphatase / guanosine-5'-triphosphate,3'-diphosphate pyrophosphatase
VILAGIDIGTNSLRLLIAETSCGAVRELYSDRRITRLGQGLDRSGMIDSEAAQRSVNALLDFFGSIRRHGAQGVAAVGTSALRNASNTREFVGTVSEKTGIDIRVISGEEEALLTLRGVMCSLRGAGTASGLSPEASMIIDIGGGSTEVIVARRDGDPEIASLSLGAVYLTERFIKHDPPSEDDLVSMRALIRGELDMRFRELRNSLSGLFIGTAGTITTLASIKLGLETYDPVRINGCTLTREDVDEMVRKLSRLTREERKTVRGLDPGREDIIIAGAVIAQELMARFRRISMLVSDWGLREGIVLDLYERLSKGARSS